MEHPSAPTVSEVAWRHFQAVNAPMQEVPPISLDNAPAEDRRWNTRALIVDDDVLVMTGTSAMVQDLGHTAIEAQSAAEALGLLSSGVRVDVVLTDHAMPSMTGLQLAECIQKRYPGLPIILATGYAELPTDPMTLGIPRLAKPCTQLEIATAIQAVVSAAQSDARYASA